MTELRWTRDSTFQDGARNFQARGPGVYDVPEEAVEKYLDHRSGAWERVDDTDDGAEAEPAAEDETPDAQDAAFSEEELAEVLDGTIGEVEEALATGDYDDVLDELEALEENGEGRKGVSEAIDDQREE
jgi:hypothetical protein